MKKPIKYVQRCTINVKNFACPSYFNHRLLPLTPNVVTQLPIICPYSMWYSTVKPRLFESVEGEKKLSTIWVIKKNVCRYLLKYRGEYIPSSYHCCLRTLYVWIFFMPSVYFKKNVESHWNFTHRYKNIPSGAIILTNNNNIVIAEFTNVSSQNIII